MHMGHIICAISYVPYHMCHIICAISYGPYHMGHITWAIAYGSYHMGHIIWPVLMVLVSTVFSVLAPTQTLLTDRVKLSHCNRENAWTHQGSVKSSNSITIALKMDLLAYHINEFRNLNYSIWHLNKHLRHLTFYIRIKIFDSTPFPTPSHTKRIENGEIIKYFDKFVSVPDLC